MQFPKGTEVTFLRGLLGVRTDGVVTDAPEDSNVRIVSYGDDKLKAVSTINLELRDTE